MDMNVTVDRATLVLGVREILTSVCLTPVILSVHIVVYRWSMTTDVNVMWDTEVSRISLSFIRILRKGCNVFEM